MATSGPLYLVFSPRLVAVSLPARYCRLISFPPLSGIINIPPSYLIPSYLPADVLERSMIHSILLLNVALAVIVQWIGIGSAMLFFLNSIGVFSGFGISLLVDYITSAKGHTPVNSLVSFGNRPPQPTMS